MPTPDSAPRWNRTSRFLRWRVDTWGGEHERSKSWNWRLWVGRCQVQLTVHQHRYTPPSPHRWVVQPHFIYDRKKASA